MVVISSRIVCILRQVGLRSRLPCVLQAAVHLRDKNSGSRVRGDNLGRCQNGTTGVCRHVCRCCRFGSLNKVVSELKLGGEGEIYGDVTSFLFGSRRYYSLNRKCVSHRVCCSLSCLRHVPAPISFPGEPTTSEDD